MEKVRHTAGYLPRPAHQQTEQQPNVSSGRRLHWRLLGLLPLAMLFALSWTWLTSGPTKRRPSPAISWRLATDDQISGAPDLLLDRTLNMSVSVNATDSTVAFSTRVTTVVYPFSGGGSTTTASPPIVYVHFIDPLGRFGNKMFQYASGLGLAMRYGCQARLVVDHDYVAFELASMKRAFVLADLPEQKEAPHDSGVVYLLESGFGRYDIEKFDNPKIFTSNVFVDGHLQSYKYFQPVANHIRQIFTLTPSMALTVESIFQKMNVARDDLLIGVHVRRGDIVSQPHLYNVAPPEFIKMAVDHYVNKYGGSHWLTFIFATNDRPWLDGVIGSHLQKNLTIRHVSSSPEVDMAVLSKCNHSIFTVGTYGWWSAWLTGGDVVYYRHFLPDSSTLKTGFDPPDYYPPNWLALP